MDGEIELISDGEGLAVIGEAAMVDLFLSSAGLASRQLPIARLSGALSAASGVAQAGSEVAATSGRWVQLTKESAALVDKVGLRESATSGLKTGVLKGSKGQVKGFVEFAKASPTSMLTNPAVLSGAAGIMAQLAMQQAMDEITSYLATIDEKVDDILRGQKDAVLADMIGVGLVIEEAVTISAEVGRVSEVTWSKVHNVGTTIAQTQAYAVRQLEGLAEKLEHTRDMGELAKASRDAEESVRQWLAVLARCVQLQDALAVLELDRVSDAMPEELDEHRLALRLARQKRLDLISRATERLMARMDAAVRTANAKVLMNPGKTRAIVQSGNVVAASVVDLHEHLGLERGSHAWEHARWADAATAKRDKLARIFRAGPTVHDLGV